MTLTTAGKDWLTINAGVNNCFSPTGVTFLDADGVQFTAGTKDVVISFIGAHMVGRNDAIIIANTSYNGFKAINGNLDLVYSDVTWVYNSDGHTGATLPLYCTPMTPISTILTVDTNDCVEPCTVNGTVSWTNNGGVASLPTDLSISYNGNSIPVASAIVINPGETLSYTFSIPGLIAGTYTVQASPDAGTVPQTITVRATPADIVSTTLTLSTNLCNEPCNVTGSVSWINNGHTTGSFDPAILINTNPVSLGPTETIDPGQTITHGFSLPPDLMVGTYEVCASPGTHCQTVVVTIPSTSVYITSNPSGATIYIDDIIQLDVTPATITALTEGLHTYRLTREDCDNEATGEFTTIIGTTVQVSATFETTARFESAPSGARIWIDGADTGIDTPGTVTVTPGHHTYKLTLATYSDLAGGFTAIICKRKNITASISKFKEAGMGFIVAGLIVGALLFGKKKKELEHTE